MNTVSWLYHGCCALQGWHESSRRRRLLGCLLVTAFSTGLVQNLRPCTFVRTVLLYVRCTYRVRCIFHPWFQRCLLSKLARMEVQAIWEKDPGKRKFSFNRCRYLSDSFRQSPLNLKPSCGEASHEQFMRNLRTYQTLQAGSQRFKSKTDTLQHVNE